VLLGVAGCGEDQTGQPGIPDVDFTPTLVVRVDDGGLVAEVGPRGEGRTDVAADPATLPAGSVVEIVVDAAGEHRVVGHLTPPGEEPPDLGDRDVPTPAPLVDTGLQRQGDTVTVVLSSPGTLELTDEADPDAPLTIEVTGRPTS
jgi:hypothetical protein